jgi:hypothetical protein
MKTIIARLEKYFGIYLLLMGVLLMILWSPKMGVKRVDFVLFSIAALIGALIMSPIMLVFCFVCDLVCEAVSQLVAQHRARKMMKELTL